MSTPIARPEAQASAGSLPRQIPFIIGNEACERFSFYGMRNILTAFLVGWLLMGTADEQARQAEAKDVFHIFVMGVYFFPLLGGWLADRWFGKYRTILWLSLVYCVGHACLAIFEGSKTGFYTGLFLIALGSGGIKPCVSAFVGDQFDQSNKHLARVVFDAFYWIINFGSFFASLLIPLTLEIWGPSIAFGIPGLLMFIATVIFWMGRHRYVNVPPVAADPHSVTNVIRTALFATRSGAGRPGLVLSAFGLVLGVGSLGAYELLGGIVTAICLALVLILAAVGGGTLMQLDRAKGIHPDEDIEGVRAVLRLLVLFALVTPFWSLFDQKASTWILQAREMELPGWSWFKNASQIQALNPLLVMALIPFNNLVLYPALTRFGLQVTPLRRMTAGIAFSGVSWVVIGGVQLAIDGGANLSILWQTIPYVLLTFAEVLVSATGLEFAYSQAPAKMKGVLMSFWTLSVTVGNLWVLLVNGAVRNEAVESAIASTGIGLTAFQMFFFAGFAFLAAVAFGLYAKRYKMVDHYRAA
ncbi:POT family MFS transporter [Vulgatibacter sp.]|uniref:POT family MFS transporter n=1 Tax=Vulgatibacter sp. TaxID=1971226 RepID=UPI0035679BB5